LWNGVIHSTDRKRYRTSKESRRVFVERDGKPVQWGSMLVERVRMLIDRGRMLIERDGMPFERGRMLVEKQMEFC
jgi:hypothetical protein